MSDNRPRTIQPPFWLPPRRPRWPAAARRWYRWRRSGKEDRSPPPWEVARLAARIGARGHQPEFPAAHNFTVRLEWWSAQPAALFRRSATVRLVAELFAIGAVLAGIVGLWLDMDRREEDRINTAWALVAAAKEVEGNVGLGRALETLHARGADLTALQAPKAYLLGVRLFGANLQRAYLSGADLRFADLSKAKLHWADLRGAKLRWADLHGAKLSGADLSGADLHGAELSNAILTDSIHGPACGDANTILPSGYSLLSCSASNRP